MPFPERRPLLIPSDPARISAFISHLDRAVAEANAFIGRSRFFFEDVQAWQEKIHTQERDRHGENSAAINAVLGVTYSVVAEAATARKVGVSGFQLGAEGQQRITTALLELHSDDRVIFIQPSRRDIKNRIMGAMSVARMAAALLERGTPCSLPSIEDDMRRTIDLLCVVNDRGACMQIKTGAPSVSHIVSPVGSEEKRLVNGTAHFNGKNRTRMIPLMVGVPGFRYSARADLVDDKVRHLGNSAANAIIACAP